MVRLPVLTAAEAYKNDLMEFMRAEEYVTQVFCPELNETKLFWRLLYTQEEKALLWHKPMKDRLTLLLYKCKFRSED